MLHVHCEHFAHHIFQSFDSNVKRFFRNSAYLYKWNDPATGEVYPDCMTLLILAFQRLRPNTFINTHKKVEALKTLKLLGYELNLSLFIGPLNEKRDKIIYIYQHSYVDN